MNGRCERLGIALSLFWCRLTRQHEPMLAVRNGAVCVRCPHCQLHTTGVRILRGYAQVVRVRIEVRS